MYGRKITGFTDNATLILIMEKDVSLIPSNRLQKMRLKLMMYDITYFKLLSGSEMYISDLLLENYLPEKCENEVDVEGIVVLY